VFSNLLSNACKFVPPHTTPHCKVWTERNNGHVRLFIRDNDDERNNAGNNDPTHDFLELFTLTVDWVTPTNTTLSGPVQVPEDEFGKDLDVIEEVRLDG